MYICIPELPYLFVIVVTHKKAASNIIVLQKFKGIEKIFLNISINIDHTPLYESISGLPELLPNILYCL